MRSKLTAVEPTFGDPLRLFSRMLPLPPNATGGRHQGQLQAALIELTAFIALANMKARGNVALGIKSEGYADSCELKPLAHSHQGPTG